MEQEFSDNVMWGWTPKKSVWPGRLYEFSTPILVVARTLCCTAATRVATRELFSPLDVVASILRRSLFLRCYNSFIYSLSILYSSRLSADNPSICCLDRDFFLAHTNKLFIPIIIISGSFDYFSLKILDCHFCFPLKLTDRRTKSRRKRELAC